MKDGVYGQRKEVELKKLPILIAIPLNAVKTG